jgi:tRNA threonylcarbamoyl adenosine modification protein (Sua5/YciO/YrdC/YwlC family)
MGKFFHIHPNNPQSQLIRQAVDVVRNGGVIVYPTDSAYAIGCHLNDKKALDRLRQIRRLDKKHNFTLVCRDLSEIATYAMVDNKTYRLLKSLTPGAYTFLLRATKEVPRRLQHPKRKTIGIRIPDCEIALALLKELNEPLMTTTLILPAEEEPLFDPQEIYTKIGSQVDLVIDGGFCKMETTSVIDLLGDDPVVIREGKGDVSRFL